jgi:hypothetical protein
LAQGLAKLIKQFRQNFERNSNSARMVPGITRTELHPECWERNPLLLTMPKALLFLYHHHRLRCPCSVTTSPPSPPSPMAATAYDCHSLPPTTMALHSHWPNLQSNSNNYIGPIGLALWSIGQLTMWTCYLPSCIY